MRLRTQNDIEQMWGNYLRAFGPVPSPEREALLRATVGKDIVAFNPAEVSEGFDQLLAHVEQFQQGLPGAYFTSDSLLMHHDQLLAQWTLYKKDGTALRTAYTYARVSEEGRLLQTTGFF